MLKLVVHADKVVEKEVRLALFDVGDGDVTVAVVDAYGERIVGGNLVTFMYNGTLYRASRVSPALGFKLDEEGRIKIN